MTHGISNAEPGPDPARLAYSVAESAAALGVSRELMKTLIRTGRVRSVKLGRRRIIPADALAALLSDQGHR